MTKQIKNPLRHYWWLWLLLCLFIPRKATAAISLPIKQMVRASQRHLPKQAKHIRPLEKRRATYQACFSKKYYYCLAVMRNRYQQRQKYARQKTPYGRAFLPIIGGLVMLDIWQQKRYPVEEVPIAQEWSPLKTQCKQFIEQHPYQIGWLSSGYTLSYTDIKEANGLFGQLQTIKQKWQAEKRAFRYRTLSKDTTSAYLRLHTSILEAIEWQKKLLTILGQYFDCQHPNVREESSDLAAILQQEKEQATHTYNEKVKESYIALYKKSEAAFKQYNDKYPNGKVACAEDNWKNYVSRNRHHPSETLKKATTQIEAYRTYVQAVWEYSMKQAQIEEIIGIPIPEAYEVYLHDITESIAYEETRNYQKAVFAALAHPDDWKTIETVYHMFAFADINIHVDWHKLRGEKKELASSWLIKNCKLLLEIAYIKNSSFWDKKKENLLHESAYLCDHPDAHQRKAQLFEYTLALGKLLEHHRFYWKYEDIRAQIEKNRQTLKRDYNSPITDPLSNIERTLFFLGKVSKTILSDIGLGTLLYVLSLNPLVGVTSLGGFLMYHYFSFISEELHPPGLGQLYRIEKESRGDDHIKRFVHQVFKEIEEKRHSPKVAKAMLDFIYGWGDRHICICAFDDWGPPCKDPLLHGGFYSGVIHYYPEKWAAYHKAARAQEVKVKKIKEQTDLWMRIFDPQAYDSANIEKAGTVVGIITSFVLTPLFIDILGEEVQGLLNSYWNKGTLITEEIALELQKTSQLTCKAAQEAHIEQLCKNYPTHAAKIRQIWEDTKIMSKSLLQNMSLEKYRAYTRSNFRENLRRYHNLPTAPAGKDAHHIFPLKFKDQFNKAGINIHHPEYGLWWEQHIHRIKAAEYNKKWEDFFTPYKELKKVPTHAAIFDKAREILAQFELTHPLPIWI